MKIIEQKVQGHTAVIRIPENEYDFEEFFHWKDDHEGERFACDTETTGLDIFSEEFRLRTLQLGIGLDSWVLPMEADFAPDKLDWLANLDLIFHNASYDWLVIYQTYGVSLDWNKIDDTQILAHLVDSRAKREGGTGHSLQELTAAYIDEELAEKVKGSMMEMSRQTKLKKAELFANIDLWNETYLRYAGMDVVLTWALHRILMPKVPAPSRNLIRYEHEVARVCTRMELNGFLLDTEYAQSLSDKLQAEQDAWEAYALAEYGTESVNANAQVAEDLIQTGARLNELTDSGAYKVSKDVLEPLADSGNLLAAAVLEAKKAKKWRTTWVDTFLAERDPNNRCHANIHPLRARTARMSITGIPAQTLPSSDWTIRRCFIADPGQVMVSCDYQAQELRVLAALSQDKNMMNAFAQDADLHQMTADASGVDRSVGKTVNFAYVYGSGPGNIAKTCNISVQKAKEVIEGFEKTYPGVKRLSDRLQRDARRQGYIQTPTGRILRVDSDRPYAALNYMIQSTSRDVTCAALLRLDAAGVTDYLRLPIHDEIIASVPADKAEACAQFIADTMAQDFLGVHIGTDADVMGPSWGSGYVTDEDREEYEETLD